MSYCSPDQFDNCQVQCKANIYFDGKVVSHVLTTASGEKKTLGIIFPGSYKFNTAAAERMEIIIGNCKVKLAGQDNWTAFVADTYFDVPANSYFEIEVAENQTEYICSFL